MSDPGFNAISLDECLWRLGVALRRGELNEWESGFIRSVLGRARKAGPSWQPTPRQNRTIRQIVAALRAPSLIE